MTSPDEPNVGALVATVDGLRYWRVEWIVVDEGDGRWPQWYCDAAEWPTTSVGKLAARDEEIRALSDRVAELEALLAAHTVPPTVAAAATGMPAPASEKPDRQRPPADGGSGSRTNCAVCGKRIWPSLMADHMRLLHRQQQAPEPPPPPTSATETDPLDLAAQLAPSRPPTPRHEPIVQLPPETPPPLTHGSWKCSVCQSDVFAQSKTDPTTCLRCVKARSNGHAAEVGAK